MTADAKRLVTALAAGLLFGTGLVISGMTQPQKILDFLDVFGQFDASLMLVMLGALAVHLPAYRLIHGKGRGKPLFAPAFELPSKSAIDGKLLLGAGMFGVGWGLSGYCPGPALTSLPSGGSVLVFVAAVAVGTLVAAKLEASSSRRPPLLVHEAEQSDA